MGEGEEAICAWADDVGGCVVEGEGEGEGEGTRVVVVQDSVTAHVWHCCWWPWEVEDRGWGLTEGYGGA